MRYTNAALALDDIARFIRCVDVDIGRENMRTLPRQQHRSRFPVAPAGPDRPCASDKRNLAGKVKHGGSFC